MAYRRREHRSKFIARETWGECLACHEPAQLGVEYYLDSPGVYEHTDPQRCINWLEERLRVAEAERDELAEDNELQHRLNKDLRRRNEDLRGALEHRRQENGVLSARLRMVRTQRPVNHLVETVVRRDELDRLRRIEHLASVYADASGPMEAATTFLELHGAVNKQCPDCGERGHGRCGQARD